jgi:hypothetical protein
VTSFGLAFGEGAGLVDDQRVDLAQHLERLGVLEQHAHPRAPPVATMIDIGVARPSAHGHAMISTATALTSACAMRGSGPTIAQTTNVSHRDGDHRRDEVPGDPSASFWMGARLRWASATMPRCGPAACRRPPSSPRMTSARRR